MRRSTIAALAIACALLGCLGTMDDPAPVGVAGAELAAENARGVIPAGLPARVLVGVFEDTGGTWMRNSGVAWGTRYRYFTKGWVNDWGWGLYDGGWGLA